MITPLEGQRNILIVEDDLALRAMWSVVIKRTFKNNQIHWAVSSEEALRILKNDFGGKVDLIISDIFLAGSATGIDFLKSEEVQSSKAKTILVSAVDSDTLEKGCRVDLPNTKFLSKPLNVVKCERTILEMN